MYPKIIHQIWYQGRNKLSTDSLQNINKIKLLHKEYKYILWGNNEIINLIKDNKLLLQTYLNFKYMHQKIDFAKYIILYKLGGIYIDMDVQIIKPFDDLLKKYNDNDLILSSLNLNIIESVVLCRHPYNCLNNGIIIAKSKADFLKYLIDSIINSNNKFYLNQFDEINRSTGPFKLTSVFNKYNKKDKIAILDWDILEPCTMTNICNVTDKTIAKHYHNATWMDTFTSKFLQFYFENKQIIYIILFMIFLLLCIIFIKIINNIEY
jgi:mannosyltransferase OCH1-like enzyme